MKRKLAILIPYFGAWPAWIDFFVESCRRNSSVDWFLFSDNDPPDNRCSNVRHVRLSFADHDSLVSEALDIRFSPGCLQVVRHQARPAIRSSVPDRRL